MSSYPNYTNVSMYSYYFWLQRTFGWQNGLFVGMAISQVCSTSLSCRQTCK